MVHNKILFLDIDGVLCLPEDNYEKLNERAVQRLELIVMRTYCKIVVSSSWRCGDLELTKKSLIEKGFTPFLANEIIGETIRAYHQTIKGSHLAVCRGNEIKTWVDRNLVYPWHENPEMDAQYRILKEDGSFKSMRSNKAGVDFSYVILDDDNDMLLCQKDYFVNTDGRFGLTKQDYLKAIGILNQIDTI